MPGKCTTVSILLIFLSGCLHFKPPPSKSLPFDLPAVEREFRAAWIASVANINWPSKPGLPPEEQREEAVYLLDLLRENNFNAVILQVRPQCDALYQSEFEPWSYYLSGTQGEAPDPFYDPLQFWIEEAHRRGLELHAWLNPYRAHHISGGPVSEFSIVKQRPELAVKLKNGYWWLDPGRAETRAHSTAVVMDIVQRYDIDGIHFDDYFYPYPSYNQNEDFPDTDSWQIYKAGGGGKSRSDWRRENVNQFIKNLYEKIKKMKRHVKFGLSPFGIWRPYNPASIRGFDQFEQLFADAQLWLNEGWIDYFTPQLYWPIKQIPQSFPVLLNWWKNANLKERHLWPGINIGRYRGEEGQAETLNQIMITRGMFEHHPGQVHWSIGPLVSNPLFAQALLNGPYRKKALIPSFPWLDKKAPGIPVVHYKQNGDSMTINWKENKNNEVYNWILYSQYGTIWDYSILGKNERSFNLPLYKFKPNLLKNLDATKNKTARELINPLKKIAVAGVDRFGNESKPVSKDLSDIILATLPTRETMKAAYNISGADPFEKLSLEVRKEELGNKIFHLIRCDDMGMSHAVNLAIKQVIESGIPLSVSVMFTCPWYQEAVEILKEHPEVSVGIHLTLNAEWKDYRWGPVLGPSAVPTLVDSLGFFFPSRTKLFANKPDPVEIERELRAQMDRAINCGIRIDYLDFHMGAAVETEELRRLVEGLATEYGLGISGYFGEIYSNVTYQAPLGKKAVSLYKHVQNLQPGINLQVLHVGLETPELSTLQDLNTFGLNNMSRHRVEELYSILNPALIKIWQKRQIYPLTYRQLIDIVDLENMRRPSDSSY